MTRNTFCDRSEAPQKPIYEQIIADLLAHNYSVIDDFLTRDEICLLRQSLLSKYQTEQFKKAAVGHRTNELIAQSIRSDSIFWIDEKNCGKSEQIFFQKINPFIDYLNRTCFMGILQKEFHYAVYPKGHFYKRHLDVFEKENRRKLSLVCYLNDTDWTASNGGELVLYPIEKGQEERREIIAFPGRIVIFESQLIEHEVRPVKKGERLSLTGWFKTR